MTKVKLSQGAIRLIWGIPLTAALMAGLILALIFAYARNEINLPSHDELWLSALTLIGTAAGGAVGVRMARLSWRQVIAAALLAGIGLIVAARFIAALFFLSPWDMEIRGIGNLGFVLFFLIVIAAGVFLLPLFDPIVRKSGPAPSLWKVALTALFVILLMLWANVVDFYSIAGVIFIGVLPVFAIMIGLLLILANQTNAGAWLGGVIVLLPLLLLAISLLGCRF